MMKLVLPTSISSSWTYTRGDPSCKSGSLAKTRRMRMAAAFDELPMPRDLWFQTRASSTHVGPAIPQSRAHPVYSVLINQVCSWT